MKLRTQNSHPRIHNSELRTQNLELRTPNPGLRTQNSELRTRSRPGSVIVLVVAVLALLAVIGTVYIVSARSERTSASSANTAENFSLAQLAVNNEAIRITGSPLYDGNGYLGGANGSGPFGNLPARTFDMPEYNLVSAGVSAFGGRSQSWLVSNLYRSDWVLTGNGIYADMTFPSSNFAIPTTSYVSPSVFDPATGTYDIPVLTYGATPGLNSALYSDAASGSATAGMFRVVADPLPNGARDDALVQLLPFSEANGTRYRFGLRILDTSRMANLNVGMTFDPTNPTIAESAGSYFNTYSLASSLIFSSTNNAFASADVADSLQTSGAGRAGAWALPGSGVAGFGGKDWAWSYGAMRFEKLLLEPAVISPFDLSDETELRSYGNLGTMAVPRPAIGYAGNQVWPNNLGNRAVGSASVTGNMNRGNFTAYSYSRDLRPYLDPMDSANNPTAYQLLPMSNSTTTTQWQFPLPGGPTWTGGNASPVIWPAYPARVAANPDISTFTQLAITNGDQACADTLTIAAVNTASAMTKICGYDQTEACAFVANYLTARWNSWQRDTSTTPTSYVLPNGPSYVDSQGPCLRGGEKYNNTGSFSASYASNLNSLTATGAANALFVGYAAQPFLNEIAVKYKYTAPVPPALTGSWSKLDGAIELYNPYAVPLSLEGFKIVISSTNSVIDFTGKHLCVPAFGYFIITENNTPTGLSAGISNAPNVTHTDAGTLGAGATMDLYGASKIYLMRRYFDRSNNPQWATVDQYDATNIASYPPLTPAPADGTIEIDYEARPNFDTSGGDINNPDPRRWVATVHTATVAELKQSAATLTLGVPNGTNNAAGPYVPLYDRTLEWYQSGLLSSNAACQRQILLNIADFARLMRFCSQIDPTTTPTSGLPFTGTPLSGPLSGQLSTLYTAAPGDSKVGSTALPADASIRFDFLTAPSGAPTPPANYNPGDPRANMLLNCLAFTDRVSDYTIDLGDGTGGLSKLRIPGQINVNTASPSVLYTIPVLHANPKLIGYILAYRWRTMTDDVRIPTSPVDMHTPVATGADFSLQTQYPGYGIRSLGELAVPLAVALKAAGVTFSTPYTLYQRDQFWGDMYNCLTVRSDTFVVYAYLEAVRQNPRYNPTTHTLGFDNSTIWYNTSSAGVTDDPTNADCPLFRVGRKRWLMLVDRSQANYSRVAPVVGGGTVLSPLFTQPRIVAIKDLPQ